MVAYFIFERQFPRTNCRWTLALQQLQIQSFVVDCNRTKEKRQKLPKLGRIGWTKREFLPLPIGAPGSRQVPLEPQFSRGQMRLTWKLFDIFVDAMEELGLSDKWMIYAGSLVGSFRHHDITPWDDDLDVLVDFAVRPLMVEKLRTLAPEIIIGEAGLRDKLYTKYIEPSNISQDSDVFPLIFRPFYKHWVPAPRHSFSVLMQSYPGDIQCTVFDWSHPFERNMKNMSIPCVKLASRYAFVERSPLYDNGQEKDGSSPSDMIWIRERLIRGGEIIHEIQLVAPSLEARMETYALRVKP
ncbi:unnamed protein product [Dibothriocephalus latus]|uniref:LicD family protein n=1 Tax=Dibothriocephalus latus TaxID=60516 RepID=A0A3P7NR42_DIBLA|nr:unnamed protein product [Dibothriocephalus latus]